MARAMNPGGCTRVGREPTRRWFRRFGTAVGWVLGALVALGIPLALAGTQLASQISGAYAPLDERSPVSVAPPPPAYDRDKPTAVVVVGVNGAEVSDVLGPYEVLAATGAMNVYVVSPVAQAVPLTGPVDVLPHFTFDELEQLFGVARAPDVVVVPAMPDAGQLSNEPVMTWLREVHARGSMLLGVCNGSSILAEAGLLKDRPATSHWIRFPGLRSTYPDVHWRESIRYVDDGDIITTGGLTSGIDALRVVERVLGQGQAHQVAANIGWDRYHPGSPAPLTPSTLTIEALIPVLNSTYRTDRQNLGVMLSPGVGEIELASVMDPYAGQSFSADVSTVALDDVIETRNGLNLTARLPLSDAGQLDRLIVPGAAIDRKTIDQASQRVGLSPEYIHNGRAFPFEEGLADLATHTDDPTAQWAAKMLEFPIDPTREGADYLPWSVFVLPVSASLVSALLMFACWRLLRRGRRDAAELCHTVATPERTPDGSQRKAAER